ncbi:MAG TPA: protein kinase [Polyangiaceae bacterium]
MDDFVGRLIDHYRIDARLGRGGMGVVYRARDEHLERFVAIKILPPVETPRQGSPNQAPRQGSPNQAARQGSPNQAPRQGSPISEDDYSARLLREARAASALNHPGVVTVHEVLLFEGRPCIVMELVDGESLDRLVERDGPLPAAEALALCAEAADALAAAHEKGILHRDVKSGNLMRSRQGRVKVLDFGLAKRVAEGAPSRPAQSASSAAPSGRGAPPSGASTAVEGGGALAFGATAADGAFAETVPAPIQSAPSSPRGSGPGLRTPPTLREAGLEGERPDVLPGDPRGSLASDPQLTLEGTRMGTPGYVAPELARGEEADARTDVFSLGCVLYELCVGTTPFRQRTWGDLALAIDRSDYRRPSEARPGLPASVDRIVERALQPKPDDRYASMTEMKRALEEAQRDLAKPKRRPAAWVIAIAGGAALVAFAGSRLTRGPASAASASTTASPPNAPRFDLTAPPSPLPPAGDCTDLPTFAPDGSLVFGVHEGDTHWIARLEPGHPTPVDLVRQPGDNVEPAPGPEGRIAYVHSASDQDRGELRSLALDGTGDRAEAERAGSGWFTRDAVFFLSDDNRAVRRRALEGGAVELLFEAPSGATFWGLAVSGDGRFIATGQTGIEVRPAYPLCVGDTRAGGGTLDCTSAGLTTSSRSAFSPIGHGLYFAQRDALVRLDLDRHTTQSAPLPFAPTSLAIDGAGARMVLSSCRNVWEIDRVTDAGEREAVGGTEPCAGLPAVGPHGELAFPVASGDHTALAVVDAKGSPLRIVARENHLVTESAFAPDAQRIVFHDASPDGGGLFTVGADGARAARRLTDDPGDSAPVWLDSEQVAFLRPEKGSPSGRVHVVAASGGEPRALPAMPGIPFGADPRRGTLYLFDQQTSGDHFFERTKDGQLRELVFSGLPKKLTVDRYLSSSASGTYFALFAEGAAWKVDAANRRAVRVPLENIHGHAQMIQADDEGRLTISFRHPEGQLFEAKGAFP